MKKLFTILFCLYVLTSLAQAQRFKQTVQSNTEGVGYKLLVSDSALGMPRFPNKLDANTVKYMGRKGDAMLFADTLHNQLYWYNPHLDIVQALGASTIVSNGGGSALTRTVVADGHHKDIVVFTGNPDSISVVNVQNTSLNGGGIINSVQIGDSTIIHYSQAPSGPITYKISVIGAFSSTSTGGGGGTDTSSDAGGGGTDTSSTAGGGTNSLWAYTVDTTCRVKYGANFALGTSSANMVALANTALSYARVPYNGTGSPNYPTYTNGGYQVLLSYNTGPPVTGNYTPLPTDTLAFRNTLKTFLTTNGTTNLKGVALINEPANIKHGIGYWNPTSAKNTINLLRSGANALHEIGLQAYDGGIFSGEIAYYEVWKDYINRGYTDSAALFAQAVFPAGANLSNWATDTAHGYRIVYMDSLINAMDSLPFDAVTMHIGFTILDSDSSNASINTLPFKQMVRYLHRVTGKPVISNEISFPNTSNADILSQVVDTVEQLHDAKNGDMCMAFFLNIPAHSFATASGGLTDFGMALQQKIADTRIQ